MVDLSVKIGGVTFKNPVLTASGTFGYGDEISNLIDVSSLGGIITKSITFHPRKGNPPPRIVETTAGMLNSIGLANIGAKRFVEEKLPLYESFNTRVIVSIAGETISEYCKVLEYLEKRGYVDGYEINISCPNTEKGGIYFGVDGELSGKVVEELRRLTSRLLIVKLTPNVTSIGDIAKAVEEAGADCVSLVNSFIGMALDIDSRKPELKNIIGGLSGPCIKPLALAKVYEVCSRIKIPVIGIGGISTGNDALEFLITGASAVEIGTATFFDPSSPVRIVKEIETYLEDKSIERLSDIVGSIIL